MRALRALASDRSPQSAPQRASAAGLTPQGVRLVLDTLARQHLVVIHGSGRTQPDALSPSHPLAGAHVTLFREEQQRRNVLLESIRKVRAERGPALGAAWLYGSVARGEDSPSSAVDIAILVGSQDVADQFRADQARRRLAKAAA